MDDLEDTFTMASLSEFYHLLLEDAINLHLAMFAPSTVQLREELLKDRRTLLMLPVIRERLYVLNIRWLPKRNSSAIFISDEELFSEFSGMMSRPWSWGVESRVRSLIKKAEKNGKLREHVAKIKSKRDSAVDQHERLQLLEGLLALFPNSVSSEFKSAFNVAVVSAVVLLCFLYQYLMGYVNRGGHKTYSSGSLDFRDIYVSIVLFQGAYVWIKFRQAACSGGCKRKSCEPQDVPVRDDSGSKGVYVRAMKDGSGNKYEPRFKPPREKADSGTPRQFSCLSLGTYNTLSEAQIVRQIAASYYGKGDGCVAFEDGSKFSIPPMSDQEKLLTGMDKARFVTQKAKEVFGNFRKERGSLKPLRRATEAGPLSGHGSGAVSGPSPSAVAVTCPLPTFSRSADEHPESPPLAMVEIVPLHGSAGAEHPADSVAGGSALEPIPAIEHSSDVNRVGEQYNVPGKEPGAPESDDHGANMDHAGDYSATFSYNEEMIAELYFESADIPPQQSSSLDNEMHPFGVAGNFGDPSPPQFAAGPVVLEVGEPQLSQDLIVQHGAVPERIVTSGSCFFFKEKDPVHEQVNFLQELMSRQKKLLQDSAMRIVDLQYQLCASEVKYSLLQQETERLRAVLQQVPANSQVSTWSSFLVDCQQEEGG